MKKRIVFCIVIFLLVFILSFCSSNKVSNDDLDYNTENNNSDNSYPVENGYYLNDPIDDFVTETRSVFDELTQNNPIDFDYNNENIDSATLALREYENKYASIWLNEMKYSCDSLCELLSEKHSIEFRKIQENWLDNLNAEFSIVNEIFSDEEYSLVIGSVHSLERDVEYRQAIRKRTLDIKFVEFCLKYNSVENVDVFVKFYYKSTAH